MPESKECKIFADVLIPGTADYAYNGIRAACSLLDPVESERSWRVAQAMAHAPHVHGKRTWFRVPRSDGSDSFISIDPGEFRITRPDSMKDIVVELPDVPAENRLGRRLSALLDYCRSFWSFSSDIDALTRMVRDFETKQPSRPDMSGFAIADHLIRHGRGNRSELIQKLFDQALSRSAMPLIPFSAAMALLQLQSMMGLWAEEKPGPSSPLGQDSPYEQPVQTFYNYVYTLAASEHRGRLLEQLTEIGNSNYRDAAGSVRSALNNDSLIAFTKQLVNGAHQYFVALLVRRGVERTGIDAPLKYKVVQAEEGYACTQTGLLEPVSFLFKHPDTEPRRISENLRSGLDETEVFSRICSPLWPCFTKKFARALVASARVLDEMEDCFEAGLRELHQLEEEYKAALDFNVDFERGWIDCFLLKAYKRKADNQRVQSYAARIAAQLVVSRSFAKEM